jgi:hypothetical protein
MRNMRIYTVDEEGRRDDISDEDNARRVAALVAAMRAAGAHNAKKIADGLIQFFGDMPEYMPLYVTDASINPNSITLHTEDAEAAADAADRYKRA